MSAAAGKTGPLPDPHPQAGEGKGGGVPALEGWFTLDPRSPQLIGSRCASCGTYYFPKQAGFCRNPDCSGEQFEIVALSRTGKLWSYTNAAYKPPEPYMAAEPFEPFAIGAVELETERMIVLGQVARGVDVSALKVGMVMELILEPLDDGKTIWKWKPLGSGGAP
jgi:uncharacterized OB-fold protein